MTLPLIPSPVGGKGTRCSLELYLLSTISDNSKAAYLSYSKCIRPNDLILTSINIIYFIDIILLLAHEGRAIG